VAQPHPPLTTVVGEICEDKQHLHMACLHGPNRLIGPTQLRLRLSHVMPWPWNQPMGCHDMACLESMHKRTMLNRARAGSGRAASLAIYHTNPPSLCPETSINISTSYLVADRHPLVTGFGHSITGFVPPLAGSCVERRSSTSYQRGTLLPTLTTASMVSVLAMGKKGTRAPSCSDVVWPQG